MLIYSPGIIIRGVLGTIQLNFTVFSINSNKVNHSMLRTSGTTGFYGNVPKLSIRELEDEEEVESVLSVIKPPSILITKVESPEPHPCVEDQPVTPMGSPWKEIFNKDDEDKCGCSK